MVTLNNTLSNTFGQTSQLSTKSSANQDLLTEHLVQKVDELDKNVQKILTQLSAMSTAPPHSSSSSVVASAPSRKTERALKKNRGKEFAIEIYSGGDIVSNAIKGHGWDMNKIEKFNEYFMNYSTENNIPLSDLTFIDIGSNVGWFTFNMAALGVNVLAFEPMQENIDLINKSLRDPVNIQNGISERIKLFPYGLGSKEETCYIISGINNFGDGTTFCVDDEKDLAKKTGYIIRGRVSVRRLDDLVDASALTIVAAKIDTEGFEGHVMAGGQKVLLEGVKKYVISEYVPKWIRDRNTDPIEIMRNFYNAGFRAKDSGMEMTLSQMERFNSDSQVTDIILEKNDNDHVGEYE